LTFVSNVESRALLPVAAGYDRNAARRFFASQYARTDKNRQANCETRARRQKRRTTFILPLDYFVFAIPRAKRARYDLLLCLFARPSKEPLGFALPTFPFCAFCFQRTRLVCKRLLYPLLFFNSQNCFAVFRSAFCAEKRNFSKEESRICAPQSN
jgi:hypothetical protein